MIEIGGEEDVVPVCDAKVGESRRPIMKRLRGGLGPHANQRIGPWSVAATSAAVALQLQVTPVVAQTHPAPPPPYVACPDDRQPLVRIPEIVSQAGKLTGTVLLTDGQQRLFLGDLSPDGKTKWCLPQQVRQ